eukprot:7504104-Heterocapsa_arctica.AAC.1
MTKIPSTANQTPSSVWNGLCYHYTQRYKAQEVKNGLPDLRKSRPAAAQRAAGAFAAQASPHAAAVAPQSRGNAGQRASAGR